VRSTTLEVGAGIHALEGGTAASALVLVHDLDSCAASWLEVADPLAEDHRVLAIDLPGFGRSPAGRHASLTAHADVVAEIVGRELDGPATIVGSSVGAVVALLAAARHRERVRSLVLLAPALPRLTEGRLDPLFIPLLTAGVVPGMLLLEPWRRSLQPPEQQVRSLLESCYAPDSGRPSPSTVTQMIEVAAARPRRDRLRSWPPTARSLFWWLARPDRFHTMADEVEASVALVEGIEDPVLPRLTVRAALERHPRWRHVPLAGVGHAPQLERPEAVIDTVRAVA
jgi:pimeloyl-ACP methyl ester carboxylesterase